MRRVAGDDHRAGQREAGANRVLAQFAEDVRHRPPEVEIDDRAAEPGLVEQRKKARRVVLQLLDEHAFARDLAQGLPVG